MTDIDFRNNSKLLALQSLGFWLVHIDSMRQYRLSWIKHICSRQVLERSQEGVKGAQGVGGEGGTQQQVSSGRGCNLGQTFRTQKCWMCACDCDATMGNLPSFPSIKDFKNKFSIVVIGELYCEGSLLFVFHETSTTSTSYPVSVLSSLLLRSWTQACTIVCKFFIVHQGFILLYKHCPKIRKFKQVIKFVHNISHCADKASCHSKNSWAGRPQGSLAN